ncbi:hypothetical protein ABKA04_000705 [Annulohypoxylon sp. FPYF3050]
MLRRTGNLEWIIGPNPNACLEAGKDVKQELKKCLQSLRGEGMLPEEKAIRQHREQACKLDGKLVIAAANINLELQKTTSELQLFREIAGQFSIRIPENEYLRSVADLEPVHVVKT